MTTQTLILRSLAHHWRGHLGVLLGAAVGTAILVGALLVGDSVRGSLRDMAAARLGKIELAMPSGDRLFRAALADDMGHELGGQTAAVFIATGSMGDGERVQVLGVDGAGFWSLADHPPEHAALVSGEALVNTKLATELGIKPGDQATLVLEKPSLLPRDAVLSSKQDQVRLELKVTVKGIVGDDSLGRFSLRAEQFSPGSVFVSRDWLAEKLGVPGRANLLLIAGADIDRGQATLRRYWSLEDAELEVREVPALGAVQLRSRRVFLDPGVVTAAADPRAVGVMTYLSNLMTREGAEQGTPYSFVSAAGPLGKSDVNGGPENWRRLSELTSGLADDDIRIVDWVADVSPGDTLTMQYFTLGARRSLNETPHDFHVTGKVRLDSMAGMEDLTPAIPNMPDHRKRGASIGDWESNFPLTHGFHPRDDLYWQKHGPIPKAFVNLETARRLWGNRYGDLTSMLYPADTVDVETLTQRLRERIDPASVGLRFVDVRASATAASSHGIDFGMLFLGMSLFLVVAAVSLMTLLFVFGVESRGEEIGTLLAMGFTIRRVRSLLLCEGLAIAAVGGAIGLLLGIGYTHAVLVGLGTVWKGAVASSSIRFHVSTMTLIIGAAGGLTVAGLSIGAAVWRSGRRPARELLSRESDTGITSAPRRTLWPWIIAGLCGVAALSVTILARGSDAKNAAGIFFGAGALLLAAALAGAWGMLGQWRTSGGTQSVGLGVIAVRSAARRRGRSLAIVGLLAAGVFLVVAVGANRKDPLAGASERSSGTGGFAFYGELAHPLMENINGEAGREALGVTVNDMAGVSVALLRVREGDDASCQNLNRAQSPRLLGVAPTEFAGREAFTFAAGPETGWEALNEHPDDDVVPAIGDEQTVRWGLGLGVGKTLDYIDERGRPFKIKIVAVLGNSILQGSLIISEQQFIRRFPTQAGYGAMLIDAPPERREEVRRMLAKALKGHGVSLTPTTVRLAEFAQVENTYLSIFTALGGLGLMLGAAGLGVVLLRNLMERRGELAALRAVGFSRSAVIRLIVGEHWMLLIMGLAAGTVAAMVAVWPAISSAADKIPWGLLGTTVMLIAVAGLLCTALSAAAATRVSIIQALREE